ncbi:DNA primase, partial [Candidatus Bipolaricaulota bacterium]|nr:DNA primase [Candidatus Bipolaricaulota bacterium]
MAGNRADVRAIKERTDIHSVISRYVSLSKSGSGYKGRCPFHKDDTPSMTVSAEKGLWHCFGCGEGGDVIAFLMKIERLSFLEAAKRLADEAGLSFNASEDGHQAKLREIIAEAATQFAKNLTASVGMRAREYLLG